MEKWVHKIRILRLEGEGFDVRVSASPMRPGERFVDSPRIPCKGGRVSAGTLAAFLNRELGRANAKSTLNAAAPGEEICVPLPISTTAIDERTAILFAGCLDK